MQSTRTQFSGDGEELNKDSQLTDWRGIESQEFIIVCNGVNLRFKSSVTELVMGWVRLLLAA